MYQPDLHYTPEQETAVRKRIMIDKADALRDRYSTSGVKLNDSLDSIRGKIPANEYKDLEEKTRTAREFLYSLGSTAKEEAASFEDVASAYEVLEQTVMFLQSWGVNVDWRNSGMMWASINKDRTDEEIFLSEITSKVFFNECHKLGYHDSKEIEGALKRGEIPANVIEAVLIYDAGLGGEDYPAISIGYKGKLHPEAQKILEQHVANCKKMKRNLGFLDEVAQIQHDLQAQGIDPDIGNMPLSEKMRRILEVKGISLEEAIRRFRNVGEI